jgi:integrase
MNRKGDIVGPKTARAPRTIRIGLKTIERLGQWRDEQVGKRVRAGELWVARYDLVVSTRVGTTITGDNAGRYLERMSKVLGIDPAIIPYDLRHTAITLQSKRGYSDWELADWAGTSERMINARSTVIGQTG